MVLDRFKLDGRTAVVTGGAAGLGQAFALALAEVGAKVAIVDRDPADETLSQLGSRGFSAPADLANEEQVATAAEKVLGWSGGKLDILINNAGIATPPARFLDVKPADFTRALTINLHSMFLATQAFLPALIASGRGSIVNLSSYLALVGLSAEFGPDVPAGSDGVGADFFLGIFDSKLTGEPDDAGFARRIRNGGDREVRINADQGEV